MTSWQTVKQYHCSYCCCFYPTLTAQPTAERLYIQARSSLRHSCARSVQQLRPRPLSLSLSEPLEWSRVHTSWLSLPSLSLTPNYEFIEKEKWSTQRTEGTEAEHQLQGNKSSFFLSFSLARAQWHSELSCIVSWASFSFNSSTLTSLKRDTFSLDELALLRLLVMFASLIAEMSEPFPRFTWHKLSAHHHSQKKRERETRRMVAI